MTCLRRFSPPRWLRDEDGSSNSCLRVVGFAAFGSYPKCCTFELDLWLDGVPEEALKLQRPAPLELLTIVSHGPREDRS